MNRMNMFQAKQPITNDQLARIAPSIFAPAKHESRSERYSFIPTIQVLDALRSEGFEPYYVMQSRTRIEGKEPFTKHMLRLRSQHGLVQQAVVGETVNEIILINSHDGTSSYVMTAGIYRFVCSNGMVCGESVQEIRVHHKGNIIEQVIEGAYTMLNQFQLVDQNREMMQSTILTEPERRIFAKAALALKYDEEHPAPIAAPSLLNARRLEDQKPDLWTTFNVVQENMLKGGQSGFTKTGRKSKTRPATAIDSNIKLNKGLWILADEMAKLKA